MPLQLGWRPFLLELSAPSTDHILHFSMMESSCGTDRGSLKSKSLLSDKCTMQASLQPHWVKECVLADQCEFPTDPEA